MEKIVFFLQTEKPAGGSQVFFLDLAAYLSENCGYETYYVNHRHPEMEESYKDSKIHFIDVEDCDYTLFEGATFFIAVNYLFYLLARLDASINAKLCVYFYHPDVFVWLRNQLYYKHRGLEDLLALFAQTDSCCFMDESNYIAAAKLSDVAFKRRYLPVTLHKSSFEPCSPPQLLGTDEINIGWLGRLDRDKIFSIINLADNVKHICGKKINIHLAGDGNSRSLIRLNDYAPDIRFIFTSYMYGEQRDRYFRENVDIVVAMGISAIDIAVLGIPTVIPIVSPRAFHDDKFVYVFDIDSYSLGWNREDFAELGYKYHRLGDVIESVYQKDMKQELGLKCSEFAKRSFSLDKGAELFIDAIRASTLTIDACRQCGSVRVVMRGFERYLKLSHRKRDFSFYHFFNARINKIHAHKGLSKVKFAAGEAVKTYRKKKGS